MVKPRTSVGGSAKTEAPAADAPIAAKSTGKTFTWQEIAQHNDAKSAWVYRGTRVYDITSWIDKHPGGRDMILLAAGRDCTDLFESYHPFSDRAHKIVESYYIGELAGQPEIAQYKQDSGFFRDLKTAVSAHFAKTGQNPRDPTPGLVRLVFILAFAWLGFMGANTLSLPFSARVFFAVLFGICQALPLLHVMHDCSHASLSDNPKMWTFFGYFCMDYFAGASLNSWYHQHIVGHHIFTNVNGVDPDVPASKEGDIRRISSFQTWVPMYKFQHLVLTILKCCLCCFFFFELFLNYF
jgi:cytochrome b involved in lipid metabolism